MSCSSKALSDYSTVYINGSKLFPIYTSQIIKNEYLSVWTIKKHEIHILYKFCRAFGNNIGIFSDLLEYCFVCRF